MRFFNVSTVSFSGDAGFSIVVISFSTTTFPALPQNVKSQFSSFMSSAGSTSVAPVIAAIH